jgi:hypothetical protein
LEEAYTVLKIFLFISYRAGLHPRIPIPIPSFCMWTVKFSHIVTFQELFNKIKTAEFTIPEDGRVSEDTRNVIRRLLVTDPARRLTATQVRMR